MKCAAIEIEHHFTSLIGMLSLGGAKWERQEGVNIRGLCQSIRYCLLVGAFPIWWKRSEQNKVLLLSSEDIAVVGLVWLEKLAR